MKLLRSILAVLTGYVTLAMIVIVATLAAVPLMLGSAYASPTPAYIAVNLLYSGAAGVVGGYVAAKVAMRAPILHAGLLSALMVGLYALSGFRPEPGQPGWYPAVIAAVSASGALAGGWLRR